MKEYKHLGAQTQETIFTFEHIHLLSAKLMFSLLLLSTFFAIFRQIFYDNQDLEC